MKQSCPHLENSWQRQTGRGRRDGGGGGLLGNTGAGGLAPAAGGWHSGWGGEASAYRQLGGGGLLGSSALGLGESSRGGGAEALRPAWRPHLQ